jgi:hypothetical protein
MYAHSISVLPFQVRIADALAHGRDVHVPAGRAPRRAAA